MVGLWFKRGIGPKFFVHRRDGSIPEWPYMVLGGRDPAAAVALRAYADEAERLRWDPEFVADVRGFANDFDIYRAEHGDGDPTAKPHRKDDQATLAASVGSKGA